MTTIQLVALFIAAFVIVAQLAVIAWLFDRLTVVRASLALTKASHAEIAIQCAKWRQLAGARPPEDQKP